MVIMYKRKELISICEKAIIDQKLWGNRDSSTAQRQVGECWALLKAGCNYEILTKGNLKTNDKTIWVKITFNGFDFFEGGKVETEIFYLPTNTRLNKTNGRDWY